MSTPNFGKLFSKAEPGEPDMKKLLVFLASSIVSLPLAFGQEACPCVPLSHQWIVEACETWHCAAAATVMANGDKYMLALPTNSDDFKWVIVRRVVSGSYIAPANDPFQLESFDGSAAAMSRFSSL